MNPKIEPLKLMMTIIELTRDNSIEEVYNTQGVYWHYRCFGRGTASSDLLNVLGFGTSEREILISMGTTTNIERLMCNLNGDLRTSIDAKGIIFDAPLSGVNNLVAAKFTEYDEQQPEKEELSMPKSANHSLILVAVKQGHTDEVMDTAKKEGVRGGSIIRARHLGTEEGEHFYGFTIQGEQEIIAMVVPTNIRNRVMEAINTNHGLKTQGGAFVYSVGVDHVVHLT